MTDTQNPLNAGEGVSAPETSSVSAQPTQQIPNSYAAPNTGASYETAGYQQPQPTSMPPAYVAPTYQTTAPVAYVPQLTHLSGGQKFGWFVVGFLGNIIGMLLAWLVNIDKAPQVKSDAIKFSVIGFVVAIAIEVILFVLMGAAFTVLFSEVGNYKMDLPYYY